MTANGYNGHSSSRCYILRIQKPVFTAAFLLSQATKVWGDGCCDPHGSHQSFISVRLTCLLSAPSGGRRARAVPGGVEGGHAHHVGGVARQVLELDPSLGQEERPQTLRLVLQLELPVVNLQQKRDGGEREGSQGQSKSPHYNSKAESPLCLLRASPAQRGWKCCWGNKHITPWAQTPPKFMPLLCAYWLLSSEECKVKELYSTNSIFSTVAVLQWVHSPEVGAGDLIGLRKYYLSICCY